MSDDFKTSKGSPNTSEYYGMPEPYCDVTTKPSTDKAADKQPLTHSSGGKKEK